VLEVGSVVKSLKGHDAGRMYVVVRLENNFAFVCDGEYRLLANPKKKRQSHLKDTFVKFKKDNKEDFKDFEIKTFLKGNSHKN
jgi:ribosomal protein L14E/L6E/L27E